MDETYVDVCWRMLVEIVLWDTDNMKGAWGWGGVPFYTSFLPALDRVIVSCVAWTCGL